MSDLLWAGLGLMLVFEGLMPFLAPGRWRETLVRVSQLRDEQVRLFGLAAMMAGLLLLFLANS